MRQLLNESLIRGSLLKQRGLKALSRDWSSTHWGTLACEKAGINVCGCVLPVGVDNDRQCPEFGCRGGKGPRWDGQPTSPQPSEKSPAFPQRNQEQEHTPHVREDLGVTEDQRRDPGHPVAHTVWAAQGGHTHNMSWTHSWTVYGFKCWSAWLVLVTTGSINLLWKCPWEKAGRYIFHSSLVNTVAAFYVV